METLVTIIVPVCNVQNYLEKCLDSICRQTYKTIEILCIDDGSMDDSGRILDKYKLKDKRITVIHKANAGYGHTINMGLKHAHGKYIQIVESDDYIKPDMTKELLNVAEQYQLDLVKSDFWRFFQEDQLEYIKICINDEHYNTVISSKDDITVFDDNMYNCTGMYSMDFIRKNQIRFNESSGASYQDNGFWFQTIALAKRLMFVKKAFYCIRRNNPNSSYYCTDKIYAMGLEFDYIKNFILEKMDGDKRYLYIHNKYRIIGYLFTAQRLNPKYRAEFHRFVYDEIKRECIEENIDRSIIPSEFLNMFEEIVNNDDNWFYKAKYNMPKDSVIRLNEAKQIIIYGAGKIGTQVFQELKRFSWEIAGFAVSDRDTEGDQKEGIPVKSIYQWIREESEYLIVIAAGEVNKGQMQETLNTLAVTNYICI
jgi:glycosyltransferase involved in cell wall biosynthesis